MPPNVSISPYRKWDRCAAAALFGSVVVTVGAAVLVAVLYPQPPWSGLPAFIAAYRPLQSFIFVPSLVLPLSFVAVLAGFHCGAKPEVKPWSASALAVGTVGAAIVCINYVIQGVWVPSLVKEGSDLVGALVSAKPGSLFWAFELFGYGIIGLAMWLAAPLFPGSGIDRLIRWALAVNGAGSLLAMLVAAFYPRWVLGPLGLAAVLAWNLLIIVIAVLLFRRSRPPRAVK